MAFNQSYIYIFLPFTVTLLIFIFLFLGKDKSTAITGFITLADKSLDGTVRYGLIFKPLVKHLWHFFIHIDNMFVL